MAKIQREESGRGAAMEGASVRNDILNYNSKMGATPQRPLKWLNLFEGVEFEIVSNLGTKKVTFGRMASLTVQTSCLFFVRLVWIRLALLIAIGGLSGCASMSGQGSFQTVLVQSDPPGASVFVDGKKVGRTPEFIEVRRSRRPMIEIESATLRQTVPLDSNYRWSKSFGRNLVFLTYAPVGWVIDLFTGAAWEVESTAPIPVILSKADATQSRTKDRTVVVAIAPPQADSQSLSDAGGKALEKVLRLEPQGEKSPRQVLSYERTLPIFVDGDYEITSGEMSSRNRLYRLLKSDVVYESQIERVDSGWILRSWARETQSTRAHIGPTIALDHDETGPRVFGYGFGLQPWWSRILPNTFGIDWVSETVNVELAGGVYNLESTQGGEWWSRGLEYLSAINISSTPDWRRSFGSRWEFGAVPSFRVSRKEVRAKNLPPPTNGQFIERDPEFRRWSISGGYGLEIGYLFKRHYFYFDLIPVFNWSQVSWRQNSTTISATRTTMTAQVEFGYTYVFDSNWLLRLFSRSQGENIEVWRDAFSARLGDSYRPTNASGVVSGLTFAYRFDTAGYRAGDPPVKP